LTRADIDTAASSFAVTLTPIDSIDVLEREWRVIERSDHISFFQSWEWIGSLLDTLPDSLRPLVVRVTSAERLVALGLLARGRAHRRGVIRSRTLHLNETGVPEYDGITLEHNGLLTEPGFEESALHAVIEYLSRRNDWDELYVGGLVPGHHALWARAASACALWSVMRWDKPHHRIDLNAIRTAGATYLDGLGSNTRYQIRRARKLYGARGTLALRHASSLAEATAWLDQLVALHQAYWRAKGEPGAFASAQARAFHAALLKKAWPRGAVDIVRVTVGEDSLGYLYNFRKGGTLYNYQSGFVYEQDAKLKPGLVCHALAAEDALASGLGDYDLLAGGGHYKQSLANASGTMVWAVFQHKRLLIGIENLLRRAKERWKGRYR
jgi:CelD/BcsL family acetyltransferase involved in cellulose biosynthesis